MTLNQFKGRLSSHIFNFIFKWSIGEKTFPSDYPKDLTFIAWWNKFMVYMSEVLEKEK